MTLKPLTAPKKVGYTGLRRMRATDGRAVRGGVRLATVLLRLESRVYAARDMPRRHHPRQEA